MRDSMVYYIPHGQGTIIIMGMALGDDGLCLRIGLGTAARIEGVEKIYMSNLWQFKSYNMTVDTTATYWHPNMLNPSEPDPRVVHFGPEQILHLRGNRGIPDSLFAWVEYEGDIRRCFSILVASSLEALQCATISDEINIINSIERFFTPHIKELGED